MKDKQREENTEIQHGKSDSTNSNAIKLKNKFVDSNVTITGRRIGASVNFLTNGESSNSGISKKKYFTKYENRSLPNANGLKGQSAKR